MSAEVGFHYTPNYTDAHLHTQRQCECREASSEQKANEMKDRKTTEERIRKTCTELTNVRISKKYIIFLFGQLAHLYDDIFFLVVHFSLLLLLSILIPLHFSPFLCFVFCRFLLDNNNKKRIKISFVQRLVHRLL